MPKKTTVLIIILTVVTALLVYLAVIAERQTKENITSDQAVVPTKKQVEKISTVFFNPGTVTATSSTTTYSVDIMVDSGKGAITGVQAELSYDPKVLKNVKISPPTANSFFGVNGDYFILFREVDIQAGKVSYAIAITPQKQAKMGSGKVGTLTFQANPGTGTTQIEFTPKSLVTREGESESVLKTATPLTITLPTR